MAGSREALESIALPRPGKWHLSESRKFDDVVVFVHFFGGNHRSMAKHAAMVNELGFDAVAFDLSFHSLPDRLQIPWDSKLQFGFMHVWEQELESVLNKIPGKKILYGFSSPSGAMALATARRNSIDVSAIICDGGPVVNNWTMFLPMLLNSSDQVPLYMRLGATLGHRIVFGKDFQERTAQAFKKLPKNFPVLSIRSWKDDVVPSRVIEKYFEPGTNLDLEVLNLTDSQHLEGLKIERDEYVSRVSNFFNRALSN